MSDGKGVTISNLTDATISVTGSIVGGDLNQYFQGAPPAPVDEATLFAARARLAEMPTDEIPPPGALPPGSRLDTGRNALFTGREEELLALAVALKGEQGVAITPRGATTTGIGGMGKSQLANEFAWRYGQYFTGGVFWLSFAEAANVPTEIVRCGLAMQGMPLGFAAMPPEEQLRLVSARWQDELPRLLIFDNCEAPALLEQWWPKAGHCHLLVTARRSEWPPTMGVQSLSLDTLPREQSVVLLGRYHDDLAAEGAALGDIAKALGDLPLALHLAGSFLHRYRVSPAAYLKALQAADPLDHPSMQGRGADHSPTAHEPHVGKTFALSYEKLLEDGETNALARAMLERAALFLAGEPIPTALLLATLRGVDEYDAADALHRLLELGLLEQGERGVRLHRLLAAFALRYAEYDTALEDVEIVANAEAYRQNMAGFPAMLQAWETQFRHLVERALERGDERGATIASNLGYHLNVLGRFGETEPLHERALAIRERVLGAEHPDTAQSLNNLAELYQSQGRFEEAEPLYERSLAILKRVVGAEHPDIAGSLNNLAGLYRRQGRYGEAEPLLTRALAIREQALGGEHPDTARIVDHLARLYSSQGRYGEAEPLLARALAIRERTLGAEHPDTATSLNNLASLYKDQGRYEKAELLYQRALAITEQALGVEHPDTAISLNNLGALYYGQGRLSEAEPLYERALAIFERAHGGEHPDTAQSLNNLAVLYERQGRYGEAEPLLAQALAIQEQALGPEHPDTAQSLDTLAGLYESQQRYGEAEPLLARALAIREEALGPEHPNTAQSLNNLAFLYRSQRRYEEAEPLYERALAIFERAHGAEHPYTAASLNNLGALYVRQGRYREAELLFARALAICEQALGAEHSYTVSSLNNLAVLYESQLRYGEAEPLFARALAIFERTLGASHPDTETVRGSLAALRERRKRPRRKLRRG